MSVMGVFDVTQHEPLDVEGVIAAGANLYRLQGHCGPCLRPKLQSRTFNQGGRERFAKLQ